MPRQPVAVHTLPCPEGTSHGPRLSVTMLLSLEIHTMNCSCRHFGQVSWMVLNTLSTSAFSQEHQKAGPGEIEPGCWLQDGPKILTFSFLPDHSPATSPQTSDLTSEISFAFISTWT